MAVNVLCRQGGRTLGFEKGLKGGAGNLCLAWWADNGPPGNMWLGSLKSAWVLDRWIIRKLGWWERRLKPYPGVVCNGLLDFLDVVVAK